MYARIPTFKLDPQSVDASVQYFEQTTEAALRDIPGYKGAYVLVDRDKGVLRVVALWESREALEASFEPTKALRAAYLDKFGAELSSLEEFEVARQL